MLYVDDEEVLLSSTQKYLESITDFSVETAHSAAVALDMLKGGGYDAVVSDYEMPGMNGIEFLKTLRADGSDIPFIIFTGRGREDVVIEALNAGADYYLQKGGMPRPVFTELVHIINQAVMKRRTETKLLSNALRLHATFDSITDIMRIVDRDFIVQKANNACLEAFGKKREDVIGKECYRAFYDRDDICPGCMVQEVFAEQKAVFGAKNVEFGGKNVIFETSCSPVNCDGTISEVVVIARDITPKREREGKIHHLNDVLLAIRNVNHLIKQEKDRDTLLNACCEILTETDGYFNAWIACIDEEEQFLSAYESGLGEFFGPMEELLREGGMTACIQAALAKGGVAVHEDPNGSCVDCPLSSAYEGRGAMTVRLAYNGTVYGLLAVSVPVEFIQGREEQNLLEEVAGDIAFALHSLNVAQEKETAESELVRVNHRLKTIIDSLPDAVAEVDCDMNVQWANATAMAANPDGIGQTCYQAYIGRDTPCEGCPCLKALKSGSVEQAIVHHPPFGNYDCETHWEGVGIPLFDADNVVTGAIIVSRDVSEREDATKRIADSEQLYRSMVDNLSELVHVVTPDMRVELFNQTGKDWYECLGIDIGDVCGRNLSEILSFLGPEVMEGYNRVVETKTPALTQEENVVGGQTVFSETRKIPLLSNGDVKRILTIVRDVTEERLYQDGLTEINKKLNLLSGITRHDLLNQITVMGAYIEFIHDAIADGDNALAQTYIEKVMRSLDTAEHIISFTREYQDLGVQAPSWQNVGEIVGSASAMSGHDGISVISGLDGIEVFADPMLNKIFINLFGNAGMHGGDATIVRLSFHERRDGCGIIIVEDDGQGVPADMKEKIFDKGVGKNTGFGLFLTTEILAITKITIAENGAAGEGARFEITVPPGAWRFADEG